MSTQSRRLSWDERAQYVYDQLVTDRGRTVSGVLCNYGDYRYDAYLYARTRKYASVLFTAFEGEAVLCSMNEGKWNVKQL